MPEKSRRRFFLFILLVCFFLSGAAGLIYQVAWSKELGLVFGHTAYAVATVLAVFMAGLASGSAWLGPWSESKNRPIALYGWIELGVAATGAISLVGLAAVRAVYVAAFPYVAGNGPFLLALRFVGAAIVLFLPTFLMGGTLPVLVRGLVRSSAELGARLSSLYGINTMGAVAGTFTAGFLLLPVLGLRETLGVAVSLNLIAGGLALWLSRGESVAPPEASTPPSKIEAPAAARPSRMLLICFAVVGATAMAYEIGWTRLLATQLGSSTYAFTLMLGIFLFGIVLGSALFERWSRRHGASSMTFAATQTLTALAALAFLVFFSRLVEILPPILRATHESFSGLVLAQFATSALAMLPAAVVFGFNFPAVVLLIVGRQASSASGAGMVGRAYAWNTLGAIVGAIATGFWLLPRLGSFHLLASTAGVNLVLAAALSLESAPRRAWKMIACAANLVLVVAAVFIGFSNYFYDPALAAHNTVLYRDSSDLRLTLRETARLIDIVYLEDGLNATISVGKTDDYVSLRTNGKVDASNQDASTQLLLGHLGALARPPRRVLLIGFGSGMTASALVRYPELERLDIVEIEPAVLGAAPLLTELNRNVLLDPRVHVTLDDARNFLFTTRDRYDLIVSEPSNPWIAGVAALFTVEFYQAVNARLLPGGVFVQWVQAYSLYTDDLRMLFATFLSEFHGATLWHVDADLMLMSPSPPTSALYTRLQNLFTNPGLHEDYDQLGMSDAAGLFAFYMLDDAGMRTFSAGARLNTDDLTLLEYDAPRSLLVHGLEDDNQRAILLAQSDILPAGVPSQSRGGALASAASTAIALNDVVEANRFLHALEDIPATFDIDIVRGRAALGQGSFMTASKDFSAALAIDPNSIGAAWGLAEANRRLGNNEQAIKAFEHILERDPNNVPALQSLSELDTDFSRWDEAVSHYRRMIAAIPDPGAAPYAVLGGILLQANKPDEAYAAYQKCLAHDPYSIQGNLHLGLMLAEEKKWAEARPHLEFMMRFFPFQDVEIYPLLYQADIAMGDPRAAAEAVRFGLRIFPRNSELEHLNISL